MLHLLSKSVFTNLQPDCVKKYRLCLSSQNPHFFQQGNETKIKKSKVIVFSASISPFSDQACATFTAHSIRIRVGCKISSICLIAIHKYVSSHNFIPAPLILSSFHQKYTDSEQNAIFFRRQTVNRSRNNCQ